MNPAHACPRPAECWGPEDGKHKRGCRPGRPLCRWRRKKRAQGFCHCHAYHFPHRPKSGLCGNDEAYLRHLMTPRRRAA